MASGVSDDGLARVADDMSTPPDHDPRRGDDTFLPPSAKRPPDTTDGDDTFLPPSAKRPPVGDDTARPPSDDKAPQGGEAAHNR